MAVAAQPTPYLSAASANALISDLRPTTFSAAALTHLNTLLDELLIALLTAARSLNPLDLRREAIPSFFSGDRGTGDTTGVRALGRNAVAEAEVELRSWQEGRSVWGYPPDGKGSGTRTGRSFPLLQAVELMRAKCVAFSTLAPQDESDQTKEQQAVADWLKVGGDASEETIVPSALWITAIIEHVCEHILSSVARIVARDSGTAVAGPQDLYTALCEDESVWGFFKRMKVKDQLELTIRSSSRSKRFNASRSSPDNRSQGRASPALSTASPGEDASIDTARSTRIGSPSLETSSTGGIAGGIILKGSTLIKRGPTGSPVTKILQRAQHERSGSALSANTRFILGAFHDTYEQEGNQSQDEADGKEAQDEFDKLVRSGETRKVSLTPGRLKSFEAANRKREPHLADIHSPSAGHLNDKRRSHSITRVPVPTGPLTPPPNLVEQSSSPTSVSTPPSRPSLGSRHTNESARKLIARTAKIIQEQDEEEELRGATRSEKESLFGLLADDTFVALESKQTPTKRTVPAVILGTPPPPPPQPPASASSGMRKAALGPINSPSQTKSPSARVKEAFYITPFASNASDADVPSEDDEFVHVQRRNRTEAQELADFFNSEPPPGLMADDESHIGQPKSSKSKGFRGFISKVSLSSKKQDDDKYRPPPAVKQHSRTQGQPLSSTSLSQPNSHSSTAQGKGGRMLEVRKQKSMGNMMTGMQSVFRNDQSEPPLPPAPLAAIEYSAPIFQQQHVSPPRTQTPPKVAPVREPAPAFGENMVYRSPGATFHQTVQSRFGIGSMEKIAGPDVTHASVINPIDPVNMSSESRVRLSSPNRNEKKPLVIGKTTSLTAATTFLTPSKNLSVTPFESPTVSSPACTLSFTTANEGSDGEHSPILARAKPEDQRSSESDQPTLIPASSGVPTEEVGPQSVSLIPRELTSEPVTPRDAVPKQDLVPLRNLLDHATSASECRLLLNAILTQFGVPYPDLEPGQGEGKRGGVEMPEGRVIAWLLAGREGPVGDYLRQPQAVVPVSVAKEDDKKDDTSTTDHDRLITPTRIHSAALPSRFLPLPRGEDTVPPSATTTEFTTDGEISETVEGQVEYVKTGEREEARLVEA